MKRFLKTGLLIILMLAFSIPALAMNARNWEQIYLDAPNLYLDTNNVSKTPDGIVLFYYKTNFSSPFYHNRAFSIELYEYNPSTSMWRGYDLAYFDANGNQLEYSKYSFQTSPWSKVNPNENVLKRAREILNNQASSTVTANEPSSTDNNTNTGVNFQSNIASSYTFQKVEGYGAYEGGDNIYVKQINLQNLACLEPSFSQTGRVSILTRAGKVFDIWIDSKNQGDNYGTAIMTHYIKVLYNGGTVFVGKPFYKKRALANDFKLPIPDIIATLNEAQDTITVSIRYKDGSVEEFSQPAFGANALIGKMTSSFITGNIHLFN